jgi:medium-chain acyl-[acyl-carrier-protein] hydrolase
MRLQTIFSKRQPWCISFSQAKASPLQLFCFHHAGGGASLFRDWSARFAGVADVVAIQLPGRESRLDEPLLECPIAVTDEVVHAISGQLDHRPYALFGHSMGASLSLRVAHDMHYRFGKSPSGVVLSGRSPGVHRDMQFNPDNLDDDVLLEHVLKFGGIPAELLNDAGLMSRMMPRLRSDFILSYQLDVTQPWLQPLPCPIIAIGGSSDPTMLPTDLQNWERYTNDAFRSYIFQGGHFFLRSSSSVFRILTEVFRQFHQQTVYA